MENENSSAIETTDNRDLTDPSFLEELRIQMMKFAVLQIKDEALAEDAVKKPLLVRSRTSNLLVGTPL